MSTEQQQAPETPQDPPRQERVVKSSVSLPGDLHDRWRRSGVSLPELLRRGLEAAEPDPLADLRLVVREAVAAELDARGLTARRPAPSRAPSWPSR